LTVGSLKRPLSQLRRLAAGGTTAQLATPAHLHAGLPMTRILTQIALSAFALSAFASTASANGRPNIVFILADDN